MITKACSKCGQEKPLSEFYKQAAGRLGRTSYCKACGREYGRLYRQRSYVPQFAEERRRAYNARHPERVAESNRESARKWRADPANREKQREYLLTYGRSKRTREKLRVFNAYGGPICRCCGEAELAFLSIDHIEGGGNAHRKELWPNGGGGGTMYRWLINAGFPPGFQVLCFNCNHGKHINHGVCPHEEIALRLIGESA